MDLSSHQRVRGVCCSQIVFKQFKPPCVVEWLLARCCVPGVLGVLILFLVMEEVFVGVSEVVSHATVPLLLVGYGFGASFVALSHNLWEGSTLRRMWRRPGRQG